MFVSCCFAVRRVLCVVRCLSLVVVCCLLSGTVCCWSLIVNVKVGCWLCGVCCLLIVVSCLFMCRFLYVVC